MEIRGDMKLALKLMADFKKSQPKKKRRNIDVASRKLRNDEPLNKRDREAFNDLRRFIEGGNG
ncbi:hypothetical protein ACNA6I_01215 [Rossellomorea sp. FS2]|uniref:hypothetical protein n=1 Tax=Rossellomorea sp. FS2 TaxID=3391447 RepID=UPI003A4D789E